MRSGERVFVDTGAWIALAETRDPEHERARAGWGILGQGRARPVTSVLVVAETFTFIDRRGSRASALRWRDSVASIESLQILDVSAKHLAKAWAWLERKDLHKLGIVDATSFVLMNEHKIRVAFAFDTHFAIAGYRYVD